MSDRIHFFPGIFPSTTSESSILLQDPAIQRRFYVYVPPLHPSILFVAVQSNPLPYFLCKLVSGYIFFPISSPPASLYSFRVIHPAARSGRPSCPHYLLRFCYGSIQSSSVLLRMKLTQESARFIPALFENKRLTQPSPHVPRNPGRNTDRINV